MPHNKRSSFNHVLAETGFLYFVQSLSQQSAEKCSLQEKVKFATKELNSTLTVNSARGSNEKQVRQVQHMHVQLKGGIVSSVRSYERNHAMLLVRQGQFLVFTQTM